MEDGRRKKEEEGEGESVMEENSQLYEKIN
jgi:hypothetical protein